MDTNFTDPRGVCQADPPEYLTVHHEGREYRLKWEAGKTKYRLHLRHLPTLRDRGRARFSGPLHTYERTIKQKALAHRGGRGARGLETNCWHQ